MIFAVLIACTGGDPDAGSALVAVLIGDDKRTTTRGQGVESGLRISGTRAQGPDWAAVVADGRLVIGVPEDDAVDVLAIDGDGTVGLEDLRLARIQGPEGARFGGSVAHGDAGLLVGGPETDGGTTSPEAGAAWLFGELPDGDLDASGAELILRGEAAFDHLGDEVAVCGDVLGVAAPWEQSSALLGGAVYLVEGQTGELPVAAVGTRWASATEGAQLGRALACRDREVLAGAPFEDGGAEAVGAVFGLAETPGGAVEGAATLSLFGLLGQDYAGSSVATGDVDGDGVRDVAIGAFGSSQVFLFDGAQLAIGSRSPQFLFSGDGVAIGDLNGDGFDELVSYGEVVSIFRGGPDFNNWARIQDTDAADGSVLSDGAVVLGDLDGDGIDDLVVIEAR